MERPSTRDLIAECTRSREPVAWGRFVERYQPAIEAGVRRALRRSRDRDGQGAELQDLVQDCYCRLLDRGCRRLLSLRATADSEVRTWLGRFAERSTRDRLKALRRLKRGGPHLELLSVPARSLLTDPTGSPESVAMGRQRLRQFARHCRRLSASDRDARILRLVYFGGLTSQEVAELCGLSPSSVDSLVHRFRRRLARKGFRPPVRGAAARTRLHGPRTRRRTRRKESTGEAAPSPDPHRDLRGDAGVI